MTDTTTEAPERITYNPGYRVTYHGSDPSRGYVYVRDDLHTAAAAAHDEDRARLAVAICGGEDLPGYANSASTEELVRIARRSHSDHMETIDRLLKAQAERDALAAQLADALQGKDCFQRMTRAHWEALCAMRNSINEYVPMPSVDSGPLFSPEDGPIYADIAERVAADLKESREYALALQQELKDRAAKSDPIIAASKRVLHDIDDLVANSEGVSGLHMNGEVADWQSIMAGGSFGAWLESVEILRAAVALAACDAKTPAND